MRACARACVRVRVRVYVHVSLCWGGSRADGSLVDGIKLGVLWYGAECTGAAPPRTAARTAAVMAALLLALCVSVAAAEAGR